MTDEVRDLMVNHEVFATCPVLVIRDDGDDFRRCGEPLEVVHMKTLRGDDYGSWATHDVYFGCGHTFADMVGSLKIEEFV